MHLVSCPQCGEEENLSGVAGFVVFDHDDIKVSCGSCEFSWVRTRMVPTCPTCGSTDVRRAARSIVDKSRGTQLSIQSIEIIYLCVICDADDLATWNQSNTPLRPREMPVNED